VVSRASPYTRGPAEGIQDFVGGRQARRIGDIPAVDDLAVRVDDQDRATNQVPETIGEGHQQLVARPEISVEVAGQDQVVGQIEGLPPGVVGPGGVDADADDLGAEGAELGDAFSELGKLVRSTRAEVEDVGEEDDGTLLEGVGEVEFFCAVGWQFEVRGGVANSEGHKVFVPPRGPSMRGPTAAGAAAHAC
jgi:hypothetical protein